MAHPLAWYDYETVDVRPRTEPLVVRGRTIGRRHHFAFNIPAGVRDSQPPAKGSDVSGIKLFSDLGITGIDGLGARVGNVWITRKSDKSMPVMHVIINEPLAYS